jgi:membrane protein implicated in regulation of membrane protease activity
MHPLALLVLIVIVSCVSIYLDRRYLRNRKKAQEEQSGPD